MAEASYTEAEAAPDSQPAEAVEGGREGQHGHGPQQEVATVETAAPAAAAAAEEGSEPPVAPPPAEPSEPPASPIAVEADAPPQQEQEQDDAPASAPAAVSAPASAPGPTLPPRLLPQGLALPVPGGQGAGQPQPQQQPQQQVDVEALTEAVLTVYTQQAQRIQEAYQLAMDRNAAAFEQALRTIVTVLGSAAAGGQQGQGARAPLVVMPLPSSTGAGGVAKSNTARLFSLGEGLAASGGFTSLHQSPRASGVGGAAGAAGGFEEPQAAAPKKRKYRKRQQQGPGQAGDEKEKGAAAGGCGVEGKPRRRRGPKGIRDGLPQPLQAYLQGFQRYLTRHHISAFKGQRLAPMTIQMRVGQAQRLFRKRGLCSERFPTVGEMQALEAELRGDKNYANTLLDCLAYLQWREGPGAAVEEAAAGEGDEVVKAEDGMEELMASAVGGGGGSSVAMLEEGEGEEDEFEDDSRGLGAQEQEEGYNSEEDGASGAGAWGQPPRRKRRVQPPGRFRGSPIPGGEAGGSGAAGPAPSSVASSSYRPSNKGVGTGSPKSEIARAARAFVNWMKNEDTGARVSHSTAYSYLIIITRLLKDAECDMASIQTPADLRAYVLGNRAHLEGILPPPQRPYPKARGAFKKLWEWASGERIWEDEGSYWSCRPSSRYYHLYDQNGGEASSSVGQRSVGGFDEEEEGGDPSATESEGEEEESELEIDDAELAELEEDELLEEEAARMAAAVGGGSSRPEAKEEQESPLPGPEEVAVASKPAASAPSSPPVHALLLGGAAVGGKAREANGAADGHHSPMEEEGRSPKRARAAL